MLKIKVLGPGCANCQAVEKIARRAVAMLGVQAMFLKVTDMAEIRRHNVLATPGLVINDRLVAAGRIPSEAEVTTWLADALEAEPGP